MTPYQNIPMQTSQNNFQFQQPQTTSQQMPTFPGINYFNADQGMQEAGNPYFHQFPPGAHHQANSQYAPNIPITNPLQSSTQNPFVPCATQQNQPTNIPGSLPQNILDQIRSCISGAASIFILPGNSQQPTFPNVAVSTACPQQPAHPTYPSFFPYPIPMPIYESFGKQTRDKDSCACQIKANVQYPQVFGKPRSCCSSLEEEEHRCSPGSDDTICTKRNCPASINLQALASQFLSVQGVISCVATRLVLRKVPGSNVTTSIEETMDKAMRALSGLTKDQLLQESRNAQQVNALINLHMTANPPANIVPTLTLIQLKVNLLKAQVEQLINRRLMETQGVGVEATNSIDPGILQLKNNDELREFLTTLRQKECEEMINVNFAPYHAQRVIAEAHLNNIRKKIQQVEIEMEKRRFNSSGSTNSGNSLPRFQPYSLTARTIQEFAETRMPLGFAYSCMQYPTADQDCSSGLRESPDPFVIKPSNIRRLHLKPHVGSPETTYKQPKTWKTDTSIAATYTNKTTVDNRATSTEYTKECKQERREERDQERAKERQEYRENQQDRISQENCSCEDCTTSEESIPHGEKKVRLKNDNENSKATQDSEETENNSMR